MADDLRSIVSELMDAVGKSESFEDVAERVVVAAASSVGTEMASLTLVGKRGVLETHGPTLATAAEVDCLQYALHEGPCVEAADNRRRLMSNDVAADPRWPKWGPAAAELGVRGVIAVDMSAAGHRLGALNIYSDEARTFTDVDVKTASLFAAIGATTIASSRKVNQLSEGLVSRGVIGQAQGILMSQHRIDSAAAFAVLRRHSQDRNVRLADVAHEIVDDREVAHE